MTDLICCVCGTKFKDDYEIEILSSCPECGSLNCEEYDESEEIYPGDF